MFTANKNVEPESWSDFKKKFGKDGTQTKALDNFLGNPRTRSKSPKRSMPGRTLSFSGGPKRTSTLSRGTSVKNLTRTSSASLSSVNRKGLLSRTKSQGNIKIGSISHKRMFSQAA